MSLETPGGLAQQLLSIDLHDLGSDYLQLYRERILAVDQSATQAVAQRYLQPEALVTLVVGPAEKCVRGFGKAGSGTDSHEILIKHKFFRQPNCRLGQLSTTATSADL